MEVKQASDPIWLSERTKRKISASLFVFTTFVSLLLPPSLYDLHYTTLTSIAVPLSPHLDAKKQDHLRDIDTCHQFNQNLETSQNTPKTSKFAYLARLCPSLTT